MRRLLKQNPNTLTKRIQYSVSEMQDLGLDTRKKIPALKSAKASVLKRDMRVVFKPLKKTIVRAKADQFLATLKPNQAYLFKVLLTQIRKYPQLGREEMNSLVMRIIKAQKGSEAKNNYAIYAADAMYKKAVKFGAITAKKV